jgi:hypothetical protein
VASFWRDPVVLTFVDEDNRPLGRLTNPPHVPRVGENVRLTEVPHVVARVGYDVAAGELTGIWVVCRPT